MTRSLTMSRQRWSVRKGPWVRANDVGNDTGMAHGAVGIVSRQKGKKTSWAHLVCPLSGCIYPPLMFHRVFLTCHSRVCCVSQGISGGE